MNVSSNSIKALSWSSDGIWIAFAACIAIVAGTFYNIFSLVAFAISIIAIVSLSEEDSLCFMMFSMPFANIFKISPGAQSFFTYLLLFYVLLYFFKNQSINKSFLIAFLCLLVFLVAQMFLSVHILRMIKFLANILLVYIAINLEFTNEAKRVFVFYILGIVLTSLIAALNIIPNLVDYIGSNNMRYEYVWVSRFAGMYGDPNYYSINVIISLCLVVVLNHKKQLATLPSICLAVILLVFAGMTMSKSAFLMLILPAILLLYAKINKKNYAVFLCVIIVCAVFMTALFSGKIELFNKIIYRLKNAKDFSSLTTGRYKLWQNYLAFLLDNPKVVLFGRGLGAGILEDHAAHNTYIDVIYYLGIVGTTLLVSAFYTMIRIKKKSTRSNLLNYSVWICIAMMYFFLSELFYFDWAFHIIIAISISKINMSQTKEEKDDKKICV